VSKNELKISRLLLGFDTETTGLDVNSERAISYGFIAYFDNLPIWSEHFYVIPDKQIAEPAMKVHGLSIESIIAKKNEEVVYESVAAGLARAVLILREFHNFGAAIVGANVVRFDLAMLSKTYESIHARNLLDEGLDVSILSIIDVIEFDRSIDKDFAARPRRGLEQLCKHYGVEPGGHHALADARATVEVLLKQTKRARPNQLEFNVTSVSPEFYEWSERITSLLAS
jgi:DNA polymerase III subunit epsilon